ncbi:MAG: metal ABC transporter ATP-binding protein [Armatimonadota bacterium]|nr:metal ABC transporter ATP-binding protein [Armatimonadota bacterium]
MTPAVEVHNLSVAYDTRPVLLGVSLTVQRGEVVGVIGPNGAGKSTFFRALLGLVTPWTGWIRLLGGDVTTNRRWVAYLPQREAIDWDFPLVVSDVVMMGRYPHLGWGRRPRPEDRRIVAACLDALGIADLHDRPIGALSGGQQQRTFLARALAQEAQILLLDEPFMGVDAATEQAILATLQRLRAEGKTALIVDHDLTRAGAGTYDRVLLLNQRLVAYGPPAEVLTTEVLRTTYAGRLTPLERLGTPGGRSA